MFYDPMIAKLITYGATRDEAADLQVEALDQFELDGLGNNIDFLSALMQHPRFREGALTTGFIVEEYPEGFAGAPASPGLLRKLAAVATAIDMERASHAAQISGQLSGPPELSGERVVRIDDHSFATCARRREHGGLQVTVDGVGIDLVGNWSPGATQASYRIGDETLTAAVSRTRSGFRLRARGAGHDRKVCVL